MIRTSNFSPLITNHWNLLAIFETMKYLSANRNINSWPSSNSGRITVNKENISCYISIKPFRISAIKFFKSDNGIEILTVRATELCLILAASETLHFLAAAGKAPAERCNSLLAAAVKASAGKPQ